MHKAQPAPCLIARPIVPAYWLMCHAQDSCWRPHVSLSQVTATLQRAAAQVDQSSAAVNEIRHCSGITDLQTTLCIYIYVGFRLAQCACEHKLHPELHKMCRIHTTYFR